MSKPPVLHSTGGSRGATDKYPPGYLEALEDESKIAATDDRDGNILLSASDKAPFKIEIQLDYTRSSTWVRGLYLCWESGKELHGGGDLQMFCCGWPDCQKFFPASSIQGPMAFCPNCDRAQYVSQIDKKRSLMAKGPDVPIMSAHVIFSCPPKTLAPIIARRWFELSNLQTDLERKGGADIYLKFNKKNLQKGTFSGQKELLDEARTKKDLVIYPLQRIIEDTQSGTSLDKAVLGLLLA